MGQPYVGEIRLFAGTFAPNGWAYCEGQLLPIAENDTLFNLIGTTYGGDGQETFGLPDLRGRVPIHQGTGSDGVAYLPGASAGVEQVTLSTQQIPVHQHGLLVSAGPGTADRPGGAVLATPPVARPFAAEATDSSLAGTVLAPAGGSQPHENMQPYLTIGFIISLFGIYPTPT